MFFAEVMLKREYRRHGLQLLTRLVQMTEVDFKLPVKIFEDLGSPSPHGFLHGRRLLPEDRLSNCAIIKICR